MDNRIKVFFSNRIVIVLGHILAWVFVFLLPLLMPWQRLTMPPSPMHPNPMPPNMLSNIPPPDVALIPIQPPMHMGLMLLMHSIGNITVVVLFYLNFYVLIPRFLYNKSLKAYTMVVLGCMFILIVVRDVLVNVFINIPKPFDFPFLGIFPLLFVLALSLALRVTIDRMREERERKEQETEGLKSELAFLRSQVSPHFLFNTMNNVVALSRVKPHLVEPTLIQLSQLMRYMLYESDENKVSLEKEVEYLESYIALQKMRFSKNVDIQFHKKNLEDTEGVYIEPMLLIPFVENAFKHGVGYITEPFIKIYLILDDKSLIFNIVNKYSKEPNEEKDTASGIGLRNVMRRLELLYGTNHTLTINQEYDIFEVHLIIHLKTS